MTNWSSAYNGTNQPKKQRNSHWAVYFACGLNTQLSSNLLWHCYILTFVTKPLIQISNPFTEWFILGIVSLFRIHLSHVCSVTKVFMEGNAKLCNQHTDWKYHIEMSITWMQIQEFFITLPVLQPYLKQHIIFFTDLYTGCHSFVNANPPASVRPTKGRNLPTTLSWTSRA